MSTRKDSSSAKLENQAVNKSTASSKSQKDAERCKASLCEPCMSTTRPSKMDTVCAFCSICDRHLCRDCVKAHKKAILMYLNKNQDTETESANGHKETTTHGNTSGHDSKAKTGEDDLVKGTKETTTKGSTSAKGGSQDKLKDATFVKTVSMDKERTNRKTKTTKVTTDVSCQANENSIINLTDQVKIAPDEKTGQVQEHLENVKEKYTSLEQVDNNEEKQMNVSVAKHGQEHLKNSDETSNMRTEIDSENENETRSDLPILSATHFSQSPKHKGLVGVSSTTQYKVQLSTSPTPRGEIKVKLSSDKHDCDISGMALLSPNELVLADKNNTNLKIVDTKEGTVIEAIRIDGSPRGLAALPFRTVAVAVPERQRILLMSLREQSFQVDRNISCDGFCFGVGYCNGMLVVPFVDPGKVQVLSLSGKVVYSCEERHFIYKRPQYVSVCKDEQSFLVSDGGANMVTKTKWNGEVTCVYLFQDDWVPLSVDSTTSDSFAVCSSKHGHIQIVSDDISTKTLIVENMDGVKKPKLVCYCPVEKRLYICSSRANIAGPACNYLKVFIV